MPADKKAKYLSSPDQGKALKSKINTIDFGNLCPAWHVGIIDFGGDWGYDRFSEFVCLRHSSVTDPDISSFPEDLAFAVLELKDKQFDNVSAFLHSLKTTLNREFTCEELRTIIVFLRRNFFFEEILPKLKCFESITWNELLSQSFGYGGHRKSKHHSIQVNRFSEKAKRRLEAINLDVDELFSLRLEGKVRVFGIKKFNVLQIVWIDTNHEVCPSLRD